MKYLVHKDSSGAWHVVDQEGYSVSYVYYDTKKEALFAAKVMELDDINAEKQSKES